MAARDNGKSAEPFADPWLTDSLIIWSVDHLGYNNVRPSLLSNYFDSQLLIGH